MFLYNAKSRYNYYAVRRCVNRGLRRLPPLFGGLKHPFTGPSRRRESRIFKGGGGKVEIGAPPLSARPLTLPKNNKTLRMSATSFFNFDYNKDLLTIVFSFKKDLIV